MGTTAAVPWHYTTLVDFIDHWQTPIAGLIALIAAIITVVVTLKVERRKVDRELDALRKSLAIELRQLIPRALGVHDSLTKLGAKTDGPITARMLESLSRMPAPIIYPANAARFRRTGRLPRRFELYSVNPKAGLSTKQHTSEGYGVDIVLITVGRGPLHRQAAPAMRAWLP